MQWDQNNITRIGMVLEFASFWFAAPEILGEHRLRELEKRLVDGLQLLKKWFWLIGVLLFGAIFGFLVNKYQGFLAVASIIMFIIPMIAMVLVAIFSRVADGLADRILQPLFETLAYDEGRRQRYLLLGAFLLTTGLGLQFYATFK